VTSGPEIPDVLLKADPAERLVQLRQRAPERFALIVAVCVVIHALLVGSLFLSDFYRADEPAHPEEIPIELVAQMPPELPPEQKTEPVTKPLPPPKPDLMTPPPVKAKPPPEKVQLDDVQVAHDAPVSGNDDKTHKGEPEQETKAPRVAPPPKLAIPEPAQDKPEQEKAATKSEDKPAPIAAPAEPQKLADDTPDAEALDKAQPEPPAVKPLPKPKQQPASKTSPGQAQKTVAQQLAALAPAPSYSFGSSAKSAPIGGGTEKASYESLLMGLINRHLHVPLAAKASHLIHVGQIGLFVDELGHLTHQALYRASGDPVLDAAYLDAVRHAAPFPAPPRGLPHGFILQYSNQE
jgi:periplasmic protein TonB